MVTDWKVFHEWMIVVSQKMGLLGLQNLTIRLTDLLIDFVQVSQQISQQIFFSHLLYLDNC